MPAACAADLREELLARVWGPTARAAARQDAELAAEMDALEAAGGPAPPDDWELYGVVPDPRYGPPDGPDAWLADLPAELLFEYIAAMEDPPCREAIVAGRLPRQSGDGCGFAAGGAADELPPGPVLAGLAGDAWVAGLDRLSDDELIGVLRAARRLASWSAALELAAVTDLATRREAEAAGMGSCAPGEHLGDEIAAALTLTARAADVLLDLATALRRLPATRAVLAAGRIDRHRATVIADEFAGLGDGHATAVEQQVLDDAPGQTTGQLRVAARRAVLAADPAAARERKERACRDARVDRWDEHAGTAARDLPPADVLAADHNLSALASSLRRAGVSGTTDQLRAEVYLALLTGQPLSALTGRETSSGGSCAGTGPGGSGHDEPSPGRCGHGPVGTGASSHLAWSTNPDDTIPHFPGGACECGADLAAAADLGVAASHQIMEIPLETATVTQHDLHEVACGYGRVHRAPAPAGAGAAGTVTYGLALQAWCVYLIAAHAIPVHRCAELVGALTGAEPSPGFVHSMITRAAAAVAEADKAIRCLIILAHVVSAMRPRSGQGQARSPASATCWSPAPACSPTTSWATGR